MQTRLKSVSMSQQGTEVMIHDVQSAMSLLSCCEETLQEKRACMMVNITVTDSNTSQACDIIGALL